MSRPSVPYLDLARAAADRTGDEAMREVVSLPLYPQLADAEVERVIEAVRASVRR